MSRLVANPAFYLSTTTVSLILLQLSLRWRTTGDSDALVVEALLWGAILVALWRKRDQLHLESDRVSSFLGTALVGLFLFKSLSLLWYEAPLLQILPPIFMLGLGLVASGFKGLRQYGQEVVLLIALILPSGPIGFRLDHLLSITTLTAQASSFGLWYSGFEVVRQGNRILLPNGAIEVVHPCTGVAVILLLLKLSAVVVLLFSMKRSRKVWVPIAAVLIGFFLGVIRVAIMAAVVSDQAAFDYWHGVGGNQIFSMLGILSFGLVCHLLQQESRPASVPFKLRVKHEPQLSGKETKDKAQRL